MCVRVFLSVFVKSVMVILMAAYSRESQQDAINT